MSGFEFGLMRLETRREAAERMETSQFSFLEVQLHGYKGCRRVSGPVQVEYKPGGQHCGELPEECVDVRGEAFAFTCEGGMLDKC